MKLSERRKIIQSERENGSEDFPVSQLSPPTKNNTMPLYYVAHRSDGKIKVEQYRDRILAQSAVATYRRDGTLTGTITAYYMGFAKLA